MKIFEIGAAGGIGNSLTTLLSSRGAAATGVHRRPDQAERITAAGGTPVGGDLISDSVDELAMKMAGRHGRVFSRCSRHGMDKTALIDGKGVQKAAQAAKLAGISRFVLVSVFPDAERADGLGESFEYYMRVKKTADVYLTHTDLLGDRPPGRAAQRARRWPGHRGLGDRVRRHDEKMPPR